MEEESAPPSITSALSYLDPKPKSGEGHSCGAGLFTGVKVSKYLYTGGGCLKSYNLYLDGPISQLKHTCSEFLKRPYLFSYNTVGKDRALNISVIAVM